MADLTRLRQTVKSDKVHGVVNRRMDIPVLYINCIDGNRRLDRIEVPTKTPSALFNVLSELDADANELRRFNSLSIDEQIKFLQEHAVQLNGERALIEALEQIKSSIPAGEIHLIRRSYNHKPCDVTRERDLNFLDYRETYAKIRGRNALALRYDPPLERYRPSQLILRFRTLPSLLERRLYDTSGHLLELDRLSRSTKHPVVFGLCNVADPDYQPQRVIISNRLLE